MSVISCKETQQNLLGYCNHATERLDEPNRADSLVMAKRSKKRAKAEEKKTKLGVSTVSIWKAGRQRKPEKTCKINKMQRI